MALILERVAWELVRRGDLASARALMEDAEVVSPTSDRADQTRQDRIPIARTWVALGDIDRALTFAEVGRRSRFVQITIDELLSEGALESARNLLIGSVGLGIFAEEDRNRSLIESVRALVDAQLGVADETGAFETIALGQDALLPLDSDELTDRDFLMLAGVYARVHDGSSTREMLALAAGRVLEQDSATYQLRRLLEIVSLMNTLSQ